MATTKETTSEPQPKPVIMITGDKGGTGKSMTSMVLLDYLHATGERVLFVDTDTSNPDVALTLTRSSVDLPEDMSEVTPEEEGEISGALQLLATLSLDETKGWREALNLIAEHPDRTVVFNGAARSGAGVLENGELFKAGLAELGRTLETWWVINPDLDALNLLTQYRRTFDESLVHVVQNEQFGKPEAFGIYAGSKLRGKIEDNGGRSVFLPKLAQDFSKLLYSGRLSIAEVAANKRLPEKVVKGFPLRFGDKSAFLVWRKLAHAMAAELVDPPKGS